MRTQAEIKRNSEQYPIERLILEVLLDIREQGERMITALEKDDVYKAGSISSTELAVGGPR